MLDENAPERSGLTGGLRPRQIELLRLIANTFVDREVRLVLLIPREHPSAIEATDASFYEVFDTSLVAFAEETGVEVINARSLLPADRFVDHIHPDQSGAMALSSVIADRLTKFF